jgi:hypothetical protein
LTLDEAIYELRGTPGPVFYISGTRAYQACQLGIEALKRIQECRLVDDMISEDYLPGETAE